MFAANDPTTPNLAGAGDHLPIDRELAQMAMVLAPNLGRLADVVEALRAGRSPTLDAPTVDAVCVALTLAGGVCMAAAQATGGES